MEEANVLEHQGRVRDFQALQDQIVGEGCYAYMDSQTLHIYNEHMLFLYHTVP